MGSVIYDEGIEMPLVGDSSEVSDGFHTFGELYEFRLLYNAALFNEWAESDAWFDQTPRGGQHYFNVHKSKRHFDGEEPFGGGWFIVMATLPTGQISNHYELEDWDLFQIPAREKADKWDGHEAADVAERLMEFVKNQSNYGRTD